MSSSSPSLISGIFQGVKEDPVIFPLASVCLAAQALLTVFFSRIPVEGPWKKTAVFSAKQVITLGMMTYQTYLGFVYWFLTSEDDYSYQSHPKERIQDEQDLMEGGVYLCRVVLGVDIPTGFLVGEAVDTMMHLHHLGMFVVATISLGYWGTTSTGTNVSASTSVPMFHRYVPFFFGVIELSSIPLALVDMFHPRRQPEWYRYHLNSPFLQTFNGAARVSFAVLYIGLRMLYFPTVVLRQVLPDCYSKWQHPDNQSYRLPIAVIAIFCVMFTILQLYWGIYILKQVAKAIQNKGSSSSEEKGKDGKVKAKIKSV